MYKLSDLFFGVSSVIEEVANYITPASTTNEYWDVSSSTACLYRFNGYKYSLSGYSETNYYNLTENEMKQFKIFYRGTNDEQKAIAMILRSEYEKSTYSTYEHVFTYIPKSLKLFVANPIYFVGKAVEGTEQLLLYINENTSQADCKAMNNIQPGGNFNNVELVSKEENSMQNNINSNVTKSAIESFGIDSDYNTFTTDTVENLKITGILSFMDL